MTLALPILNRTPTDGEPFEPARLDRPANPDIAEFHRDGRVLCIEPISGAWAVCWPFHIEETRRDLLAKRRAWQLDPPADEAAAPPASVTVPLKNKHCNLLCDYCFAESEGHDNGYPPPELMLKFIRLVEDLHPDRLRIFVFHGGEPLIDWRVIESLLTRYRAEAPPEHGSTVFSMVTNGTLITPAIASRMRELDVTAAISLDGPAPVHDRARHYLHGRGSFDRAMRGFELLRSVGIIPGTLSTIVDPADLADAFRFFRDSGIDHMFLRPLRWQGRAIRLLEDVVRVDGEEAYQRRFATELLRVGQFVVDHNRTDARRKLVEYGLAVRASNLVRPDRPYMCLRSPCGAVSGHKLGLDGHGNVFPCDTMVEFPELAVAHVSDIDDAASLKRVLSDAPVCRCLKSRRVENIHKCSTCHVQRFCGGECTAASYAKFGKLNREGDRCVLEQTLFEELLWMLADDWRNVEWLCPGTFRNEMFAWCDEAGAS